ncbi:MAG: putative sulfate/molybdate transporter [Burkholderiales bacterium]|nr:putative sulfate/molybdate transporter [Burkholderiales bacterium]
MSRPDLSVSHSETLQGRRLRFDRMELAGSFGDIGTLIPFLVAYIVMAGVPAMGILFAFGVALIAIGLYYRTPFPVQPMKAAGAVVATQAGQLAITAQVVYCATLLTGLVWLLLAVTGLAKRIAALVTRPVVVGIVLGLGIGFMLQGARMIAEGWVVGGIALFGALLLLENRYVPVMFLLLVFGAALALIQDPAMLGELRKLRPGFEWPQFALRDTTWRDWSAALLFLVLPQLPLTLGNAIIAVTEENNRLFPDRPVTEQRVSATTGLMNLFGGLVGGVPMCHGAGGLAGHVRFGARTGGAPVMFGIILLVLALFFSGSVDVLLRLFPTPVLGAILFLTGVQLALGSCDFSRDKGERFVTVAVTALALWNVGIAFLFGLLASACVRRGWIRL